MQLWDMEELLGGPQLNHQNDMPEANAAVHHDELPEANAAINHDELPEANAAAGHHDELPEANVAVNHNQLAEADSDDDGMDVDMEPSSSNGKTYACLVSKQSMRTASEFLMMVTLACAVVLDRVEEQEERQGQEAGRVRAGLLRRSVACSGEGKRPPLRCSRAKEQF